MSILIHEQARRRIIFYPDDLHLRQYAVSCPTLISIRFGQTPRAPRTHFVLGWSLGKMTQTLLKPRSFSSRSQGKTETNEACREVGVVEDLRSIELCASYG